jgi:phytoene dehydrogenase-like protein
VLERSHRLGGGCTTDEVTLPGFKHDLYGSSHVWIHVNPDFKELQPELEARFGLKYIWAEDHITGHPSHEGPGIVVYRDVDKTCASIAHYSEADARRYREIYDTFVDIRDGFVTGMFSPPNPPSAVAAALETTDDGVALLRNFSMSPLDWTLENFENEHVRSFILGWATAPGIRPDQEGRGELFYIMIPAIHEFGESIPEGGSIGLPLALAQMVEAYGGVVVTDAPVAKFITSNGSAEGVRLADGREFRAGKAVVTGLHPKLTFLDLMDDGAVDAGFKRMVENYNVGEFTIVRAHFALNEPPRYTCSEEVSRTPFQRIFGSVEDTRRQWAEISTGVAPPNPFLWVACWTLKDPTRAPAGKHTLIMDTFVPMELADGRSWDDVGEDYVWNVELPKLQEYAPNMTEGNILAAHITTGPSIERDNPCLVKGSTTGGAMRLYQSGYFRPFPGYSNYRGPLEKLYMTGPYCHPGGAISGAGTITANVVLEDLGLRTPEL